MKDLTGRVAVVTGAASGIGLATATRFAREGMKVAMADIEEQPLQDAVRTLQGAGHEVIGVRTDVAKWEAVQNLAEATIDAFGGVHVLHNNAGVVVSGPVSELSLADWEWVLGVDLWSVIYGIKAFLPLIKRSGEGHVVNTASTAGLQSSPSIGPYNVAKFGVVAITETLRLELEAEKSPVSASVLCPGAINTQIVNSKRNREAESARQHEGSAAERMFEERAGRLLVEHGKDPSEVADMIVNAIVEDEFWILTHPEWKNVLQERVAAMIRDNSLHSGFAG
jgi:NAD(P)-dependent dehydrogenase (short-subunit alcohol dehydrogenase family)